MEADRARRGRENAGTVNALATLACDSPGFRRMKMEMEIEMRMGPVGAGRGFISVGSGAVASRG